MEVCCKPAGRVIGIPIGTFWMLQYMIENILDQTIQNNSSAFVHQEVAVAS